MIGPTNSIRKVFSRTNTSFNSFFTGVLITYALNITHVLKYMSSFPNRNKLQINVDI